MTTITTSTSSVNAHAILKKEQANYAKARGRAALIEMVVDGFIAASTILADLTVEEQVLLLNQHQINMATGSTSPFSPLIAAMWGEHDLNAAKVPDLDGVDQPKWVPNKSMAVYFHTMETLREQGFGAGSDRKEMIAILTKAGGAQKVANARKKRLADQAKPARIMEVQDRRKLYLDEGPQITIDLPASALNLPAKAGKFVTIIVERDGDSLIFRGLAEKDADARLTKLADENHVQLQEKVERRDLLEQALESARAEAREQAIAEFRDAQGESANA